MHEKPSEAQLSECAFMANYGFHCGRGEGCRAKAIKNSFFNVRAKILPAEKERMRSHIEQVAAQSGCPNFAGESHPESGDRMGHEGS